MCLSKGITGGSLPLALTLASEAIWDAHYSTDRSKTFFHSSSYTANPIACAAANANLAVWREEPVLERIAALASMQQARIDGLRGQSRLSGFRRTGTIAAMEMDVPDGGYLAGLGPKLTAFFRERGLLLRTLGNTIYVMPPYCIDAEDLDRIYAAIGEAAERSW
jgi:adenosylmethionine-8-amino-7-oxononanoate aminotransferase